MLRMTSEAVRRSSPANQTSRDPDVHYWACVARLRKCSEQTSVDFDRRETETLKISYNMAIYSRRISPISLSGRKMKAAAAVLLLFSKCLDNLFCFTFSLFTKWSRLHSAVSHCQPENHHRRVLMNVLCQHGPCAVNVLGNVAVRLRTSTSVPKPSFARQKCCFL